mgnify:CR=1 FL=1
MNNIHMKSINQYICEALKLGKSRDPKTALDKTFNTFEELRSIIEELLYLHKVVCLGVGIVITLILGNLILLQK